MKMKRSILEPLVAVEMNNCCAIVKIDVRIEITMPDLQIFVTL